MIEKKTNNLYCPKYSKVIGLEQQEVFLTGWSAHISYELLTKRSLQTTQHKLTQSCFLWTNLMQFSTCLHWFTLSGNANLPCKPNRCQTDFVFAPTLPLKQRNKRLQSRSLLSTHIILYSSRFNEQLLFYIHHYAKHQLASKFSLAYPYFVHSYAYFVVTQTIDGRP